MELGMMGIRSNARKRQANSPSENELVYRSIPVSHLM
jgi:hypothetical protein